MHMLIIYEDGTEVLKKATDEFKELIELSLDKKSMLDTNEAKFGRVKEVKMYNSGGFLIEKKSID